MYCFLLLLHIKQCTWYYLFGSLLAFRDRLFHCCANLHPVIVVITSLTLL